MSHTRFAPWALAVVLALPVVAAAQDPADPPAPKPPALEAAGKAIRVNFSNALIDHLKKIKRIDFDARWEWLTAEQMLWDEARRSGQKFRSR